MAFHEVKKMSSFESANKVRRLVVCMSPSMKKQVIKNAKAAGISASQYVRMCIAYFQDLEK